MPTSPNDLTVTLTATNGTLTLFGGPVFASLSFTAGDGTADATMTFTGSQADINAALDGLVYTNDGTLGAATITITTEDNDTTAPGGRDRYRYREHQRGCGRRGDHARRSTLTATTSTTALGSTAFVTSYDLVTDTPVAIADTDSAITGPVPTSATVTLTNATVGDSLIVDGSASTSGILTFGGNDINWTVTVLTGQIIVLLDNGAQGTATADDYEAALELVTFATTASSTLDRTVTTVLDDGTANGNTATTTIVINDAPVVDLDGPGGTLDYATAYSENGTPAAIADSDVAITDDGTRLVSATVILTNHQAGDALSIDGPAAVRDHGLRLQHRHRRAHAVERAVQFADGLSGRAAPGCVQQPDRRSGHHRRGPSR